MPSHSVQSSQFLLLCCRSVMKLVSSVHSRVGLDWGCGVKDMFAARGHAIQGRLWLPRCLFPDGVSPSICNTSLTLGALTTVC